MDDLTIYGTFIKRNEEPKGEVKKEVDETLDECFDFTVNEVKDRYGLGSSSSSASSEFCEVSSGLYSSTVGSTGVVPGATSSSASESSNTLLWSSTWQSSSPISVSSTSSTQNMIFDVMASTYATTSTLYGSLASATSKLITSEADFLTSFYPSQLPSSSSQEHCSSGHLTFWSDDSSCTSSYKTSSSSISHSPLYSSVHYPSSSNSIYDSSSRYFFNPAVYDSSYGSYDSNVSSYASHGSSLICSSITPQPASIYTDPSRTINSTMTDHFSTPDEFTNTSLSLSDNLHQMETLQFKMDTDDPEFMMKQEDLEQDYLASLQLQFKDEDFDTIYRTIDESSQLVAQRYIGKGNQGKEGSQIFLDESVSSSFVPHVAQDFDAFDDLEPISSDHELMIDEMLEDMENDEDILFRNFKVEPEKSEKKNRESSQVIPTEEEEGNKEEEEEEEAKGSKKFTTLGYWCDQAECQLKDKKLYKDKVALNRHLKSSHGIEAHRCSIHRCGMSFANKYKLSTHVTTVHGRLNSFNCDLCTTKPFRTFNTFACHNSKFHEHAHYVCTLCTFTGTYRQAMYYHWSSVHEIRRVCAFCDRAFVRKSHYDAHLRIHTQVKPYRCIFPGCATKEGSQYMSTDRSSMVRHVRTVHFGLPRYLKEQKQQKIVDTRDPHQYIEIVREDFKS